MKTLQQAVDELSAFLPEHADKLVIHEDDWHVVIGVKGPTEVPPDATDEERALCNTIAIVFQRHEWFPG